MSLQFTTNQSPATGSIAFYLLVTKLLAVGWLQKGSGDATTFSNSAAGPVASGNTGATGLGNTSAWIRLQMPTAGGVTREMILQKGTNGYNWRIKYSRSAGFTGGSPSATQTPSATDEVYISGGGTDASPTYGSWLGTDNTYRCNVVVQDAAPYGFCWSSFGTGGTSTSRVGFMLDPIVNAPSADPDPYVWYTSTSGAFAWTANGAGTADFTAETSNTSIKGYLSTTVSSANFVSLFVPVLWSGAGVTKIYPGGFGSNPFDSTDALLPVYWLRRVGLTSPVGFKGQSTFVYWNGTTRSIGDTLSVAGVGAKDRLVIGDVSLPWDGSTPTV